MADLRIDGEPVPFALYGLAGGAFVPQKVAAVGRTAAPEGGMRLNHVALAHVDPSRPTHPVLVGVAGPLHWAMDGRVASMDPMPMVVAELLDTAGATFASVDDLEAQTSAVLERGFDPVELDLGGERKRFGAISSGEHWAAMRHIAPVHLLYVIASRVPPGEVRLREIEDLSGYA